MSRKVLKRKKKASCVWHWGPFRIELPAKFDDVAFDISFKSHGVPLAARRTDSSHALSCASAGKFSETVAVLLLKFASAACYSVEKV